VVREENADHVFVETAPNTFVLRRVKVGDEMGEKRVVLEGLTAADRIVVEGAFHLNNERKRRTLDNESGD
jgi:membrane fusion protein, heavy metal efflux system